MDEKRSSIGLWAFLGGLVGKEPVSHEKAVETVAGFGFDGIEVAAFPPYLTENNAGQRKALRKLYDDNGLGRSGLYAPLPSPVRTGISVYRESVRDLLDICSDVGIPKLRVDAGEPPTMAPGDEGYDDAARNVAANWNAAAEECLQAGVKLVWEFEPRFLFNRPTEIISMVERVDHPNFSLLFDTCHGYMCAEVGARQTGDTEILPGGIGEFIDMCRGFIGHIHLIDSDGTLYDDATSTHAPLGKGLLNFDEIMPAIARAGYNDQWWVIDLSQWPEALNVTAENKRFLDGLIDKYGR